MRSRDRYRSSGLALVWSTYTVIKAVYSTDDEVASKRAGVDNESDSMAISRLQANGLRSPILDLLGSP